MSLTARDFIGDCCSCPQCHQAGVTGRPTRRDPHTGAWLHGYPLRRWYDAKARFEELARLAVGPRGRREQMERLAGGPDAASV